MRVTYLGLIRHVAGAEGEAVDLPRGATVRDLLHVLEERHGKDLEDMLFENDGEASRYLRVIAGTTDIDKLNGLDTPLDGLEEVALAVIIPQVGGGAAVTMPS